MKGQLKLLQLIYIIYSLGPKIALHCKKNLYPLADCAYVKLSGNGAERALKESLSSKRWNLEEAIPLILPAQLL